MRKSNLFLILMALLVIILSGCKQSLAEMISESENSDTLNENDGELLSYDIKKEISDYMNQFMTEYMLPNGMEVDKRALEGGSTEGGEIVRYKNSNGLVIRYGLTYYGEMGVAKTDYYFINDIIYYSELLEHYSCPIYIGETDILYRELEEGIIIKGVYYRYDNVSNTYSHTDAIEMPYNSLEELNELFDKSQVLG